MFETQEEMEAFIGTFEACSLPKPHWTHHAHLVVGLWYLSRHSPDEALRVVRQRIRAYNEATGTANTDSSGYHETLTRFFLLGIQAHRIQHPCQPLPAVLALLLQSPMAEKEYPLRFYSRECLLSAAARQAWVEPDIMGWQP
ncbi:MAG: hypothetical protein V4672_23010 [Verrucomicrobiota bacterium]